MKYETKVTATNITSLRTTIPQKIAEGLDIHKKDTLEWDFDIKTGEVKFKKKEDTK